MPTLCAGNHQVVVKSIAAAASPLLVRGASQPDRALAFAPAISSTLTARNCGYVDATFNNSTDASWTGNLFLYAGDYNSANAAKRLGLQVQSNGSVALVGLFGATPVVQPATTGTTTGYTPGTGTAVTIDGTFTGGSGSTAYTVADIVLALKQLGLLKS